MKKIFYFLLFFYPIVIFCDTHFFTYPDSIFIGSKIQLKIKLEKDSTEILKSPLVDTITNFVVEKNKTLQKDDTSFLEYDIIPFSTGILRFPSMRFGVVDTFSNLVRYFSTNIKDFFVHTTIDDSFKTVTDIAPVIKIGFGFWEYFLPIFILILIILSVLILKKYLKNKTKEKKEVIDLRAANVKALELMKKLESKKLLEKGNFLEYYFELTFILKFFLHEQYHFNAIDMTTLEIDLYMNNSKIENRKKIKKIFNYSDMIKFAKQIPQTKQTQTLTNWIKDYFNSFEKREDGNG